MIIIAFDSNKKMGGYGDRILGTITSKVMAKLLNKKLQP